MTDGVTTAPGEEQAEAPAAWYLQGFDAFSEEWYSIGKAAGYEDSYGSYSAALLDAWRRLRDLEALQPSASSSGQKGMQDRVWIVHPDGYRERVLPGPAVTDGV